jgi:hypothetical protein
MKMKAYQIKNLEAKIQKQEGIVKAIKRNLSFENLKAYQVKGLKEKLQTEMNVLVLMNKTLNK